MSHMTFLPSFLSLWLLLDLSDDIKESLSSFSTRSGV